MSLNSLNKKSSSNIPKMFGFTIVELLIAVGIVGVIMMIAVPAYEDYTSDMDDDQAISDISIIKFAIDDYLITNGSLPNSLADIGMGGKIDPWGNPYVYANHAAIPPGHRRKDHSLVPINSDYDLYSRGEDESSAWPLTANPSRDDIVRGRDGDFIGKASDY